MIATALTLIAFLFPLAYSPGPGNLFFAANGARFGFRSTLQATAGYHVATWLVTAAIGFGLIAAFEHSPQAFQALKVMGGLYVLWIALKMLRSGAMNAGVSARPAGFGGGVMLLILNPKAYVIIALMFTQFLGESESAWVMTVLLLTTVFTLNNLLAFSVWTLVGDRLAHRFRSPKGARRMNTVFGFTLALVALWIMAG